MTAKLVRLDILRWYQKIFYFVLSRNRKSQEEEIKFGAHSTSHLTSISHLTSKPTHDASRHPARWRRWEDARVLYCAQEAWPRCQLEAYDGGGYDVACRRVRTACYPPSTEKLIRNPLRKMKPPGHPLAVSAQTPAHTD